MTTQIVERPHGRHAAPYRPEDDHPATPAPTGRTGWAPRVWAVTRIALGFIFLWAFLDKTFGLGFSTPAQNAWINGGNPTAGYLGGVEGPFSGMFHAMAGNPVVNVLFMAGLLGVGLALILGIGMRVAAVAGALMMVFMWMASLPMTSNPVIDDHLIYALVLVGLAAAKAGDTYGLGRAWGRTALVRNQPWLH
ncbi:DoxX family protein [Nonomuraea sp. NPDC050663]|uniref:DoxX family protein n=1 Tax=Nonomuraea sp. NPDC050663 TaxID=3364370 RepID=UPI003795467C